VIISSAPGIGNGLGFEPVAMTMCFASMRRPPASMALGPTNLPWSRIRSTPRSCSDLASRSGMPLIRSFSRSSQRRPIEGGLADLDAMHMRPVDLVQGMGGGHQNFFRGAAAVGTGAAEIGALDHEHLQAGFAGRHGDAEAGIAAAQDRHVVGWVRHDCAIAKSGDPFQCSSGIDAIGPAARNPRRLRWFAQGLMAGSEPPYAPRKV
jgi:hypothetical protein